MPRYIVTEVRAYEAQYLIEADDMNAAASLSGEIIDESDCSGPKSMKIEQVDEHRESL